MRLRTAPQAGEIRLHNPCGTGRFNMKKRCHAAVLGAAIRQRSASPARELRAPSHRRCVVTAGALRRSDAALQPFDEKR
jgi:hypothetical protein